MNEWWQRVFNETYLDFYRPILTSARTQREVEFVLKHLAPVLEATLLDVPCGYGRHAIELAALGYRVIGADYSPVMVAKAQRDATALGVVAEFIEADMRRLPLEDASVDAAMMLFTSFGYLGDEGDRATLAELARVVRPGGRFLIDQQNGWPAAREAEQTGQEIAEGFFEIRSELDTHEGLERMVWHRDSRLMEVHERWQGAEGTQAMSYRIRVYSPDELEERLMAAGFIVTERFGNFNEVPLRALSERMILVAQRAEA